MYQSTIVLIFKYCIGLTMSDSVEGILDLKDKKTSKIAKNMSDSY